MDRGSGVGLSDQPSPLKPLPGGTPRNLDPKVHPHWIYHDTTHITRDAIHSDQPNLLRRPCVLPRSGRLRREIVKDVQIPV